MAKPGGGSHAQLQISPVRACASVHIFARVEVEEERVPLMTRAWLICLTHHTPGCGDAASRAGGKGCGDAASRAGGKGCGDAASRAGGNAQTSLKRWHRSGLWRIALN